MSETEGMHGFPRIVKAEEFVIRQTFPSRTVDARYFVGELASAVGR